MKTFLNLWQYFAEFFLEWKIFQTKSVGKIKTYSMFSNFFFFEKVDVYETVLKNMVDNNIIRRMRFACWKTKATNTLIICNTHCFPTGTTLTRTCPNITFIRILSVLFFLFLFFLGWGDKWMVGALSTVSRLRFSRGSGIRTPCWAECIVKFLNPT